MQFNSASRIFALRIVAQRTTASRTTAVALALVASAAAMSAQTTPLSPRASLVAAENALSTESRNKGFTTALSAALADNATVLVDGAPTLLGKAVSARLLAAQKAMQSRRVQWTPIVVETSADGLYGVSWGVTAIDDTARASSAPTRFGKYISAWERTDNGPWHVTAHIQIGLATADEYVKPAGELPPVRNGVDPRSAAAEMARADDDFAKLAGVQGAPKAFAAYAAPDAVTFSGALINVTPPTIQSRLAAGPVGSAQWSWHAVIAGGSVAGDLGFTVGESVISAKTANGTTDSYFGKYLTLWKKQPDGSLKYLTDGGNSRPEK